MIHRLCGRAKLGNTLSGYSHELNTAYKVI